MKSIKYKSIGEIYKTLDKGFTNEQWQYITNEAIKLLIEMDIVQEKLNMEEFLSLYIAVPMIDDNIDWEGIKRRKEEIESYKKGIGGRWKLLAEAILY